MSQETSIGAGQSRFPSTAWDLLAGGPSEAEYSALAARYWRPVYRFIRTAWRRPVEEAKDLTQEFFASVFDKDFLGSADPARGNFRKFLLGALRNFLRNRERDAAALKRGGGRASVPIDLLPEDEADPDALPPETAFDRAWAGELLRRAVDRLKAALEGAGRPERFAAFRRHELEGASYREVAAELGLSEREVSSHLISAGRELRRICTELVRETVRNPAEVEAELAELFGAGS